MQRNLKLLLAYEGTNYLGWQKVQEGPTIEAELEKVFERILRHPVKLQAASRTDAGVHALGQVVNFFTTHSVSTTKLLHSANALLPTDIRVMNIEEALRDFHPTLDCLGKEYHYFVCYGPLQLPHLRHTSWHYYYPFELNLIQEALPHFVGTRDFRALCNKAQQQNYEETVRTVSSIQIEPIAPDRLLFKICGNHFLYKMVRNIVGTLLYIGRGKIVDGETVLNSNQRTFAGITAPAHGLFLNKVYY